MTPMTSSPALRGALPLARAIKAVMIANGDLLAARAYGAGQASAWSGTPETQLLLKNAVAALSEGNDGSVLAYPAAPATDFLAAVRARTVLGRVTGLRRVPPNTSMLRVGAAPVASWVQPGQPLRIGRFALERDLVALFQLAAAVVVTEELLLASGELADLAFASELIRSAAAFEDRALLDPTLGAAADVSPGSITSTLTPIISSGGSADQIRADFAALLAPFNSADAALDSVVIVMHPRSALHMSQLTTTNGSPIFPSLGVRGGEVNGLPVLVTAACELVGSPGEAFMVAFDPQQILYADDGVIAVDATKHASLQLDDSPVSGPASQVSLWASGLRGLKLVRNVAWKLTSSTGASVMTEITW